MPRAVRRPFWERFAHSKLTLALGLFVVLFAIVSFARELYRRIEVNHQIEALQNQVRDLENRKTSLTNLLEYFESPLFQEQEGREKLGLAKPGESVVIVPLSGDGTGNAAAQNDGDQTPQVPNPKKWWQYFFPST